MKFGLSVPGLCLYPPLMDPWERSAGSEAIVTIARKADTLGFDWLAVPDHIVMTPERAEVMGPRWCEAATTMAFLAGVTSRVRVLSNVMVVPYRHPIILAEFMSTLDFMSGGRVILGVGLGGSVAREDELFDVPPKERGAIADEYLRAMKEIWTSDEPSFHGRYISFDDMVFEPKPLQKPHPPVWIGGNSRAAMTRAAKLGDGWMPWGVTPREMPQCLEFIRHHDEFGDQRRPFDVIMPAVRLLVERDTHRSLGTTRFPQTREQWIEAIADNAEAGATGVGIEFGGTTSLDDYLERMESFAQHVMPAFRG